MTSSHQPIADSTRAALLIDWILCLIEHLDPVYTHFHPRETEQLNAIKDRLSRRRPLAAPPDLAALVTKLTDPRTLTNLHAVLLVLNGELGLMTDDDEEDFPWQRLYSDELPTSLDNHKVDWQLREHARLLSGIYKALPWADTLPSIAGHFAHISLNNEDMIAFTETPEKGARDLQTQIKPGRYLARFYPDLAPHEVRDLSARLAPVVPLKFAVTPDDIEDIYTRGPSSCMSHDPSDYEGHCHPVRVYGNSDLQLAYITDEADTPIARALVWPEKKRFGRIYGNETLLAQQLERAGYGRGSFLGARIRHIRNEDDDNSVIMPYVDGAGQFRILDDDWLAIGGDLAATGTSGIAYIEDTSTCARCDRSVPDDHLRDVDGESWCRDCRDNYSFICAYSHECFPEQEACEVVTSRKNGQPTIEHWSSYARDEHATYCDATRAWYADSAFDFVHLDNGKTWVQWHFDEHGETRDGKHIPKPTHDAVTQQVAA